LIAASQVKERARQLGFNRGRLAVLCASLGDYPALGKKAAAAIPGATLVEIPGVGHLPQVEAFDTYAQALAKFLQ